MSAPTDAEPANPDGRAIALHKLEKTGGRRALAPLCPGVGQGVALAIERG